MMDWTDRHCRVFHRQLTRRALLFTEMVTSAAIVHGDRERLLGFSLMEQPLAAQLGGSDPAELAEATRIATSFGYDEINLNVGCPSDRVQSGRFGACLMREPALVGECVKAMRMAASVPVTVKCRIGVDDQDDYAGLQHFTELMLEAGVGVLVVHARKAWLSGLSPKENRDVPPLDYALVRDLKRERPALEIILNGGLRDLDQALEQSAGLDGAMLGRAAYQSPAILLDVDPRVFGIAAPAANAVAAAEAHLGYIAARLRQGAPLHAMTRHMLGLFNGVPGGRAWRRVLSQQGVRAGAGVETVRAALEEITRPAAQAA
jgi:tRNA-dihydrouridine synthase A